MQRPIDFRGTVSLPACPFRRSIGVPAGRPPQWHPKHSLNRWLLLLLAMLGAVPICRPADPAMSNDRRPFVLVLHSYSPSAWDNGLQEGLNHELISPARIDLYVDYMDTRKIVTTEYLDELRQLLVIKYRHIRFDLVVVCNDNAYQFALRYRQELWPGVPIVFCGVKTLRPPELAKETDSTGISENPDLTAFVAAFPALVPGLRTLHIVRDDSPYVHDVLPHLLAAIHSALPELKVEYLESGSAGELTAQLEQLGADSAVVYLSYWRERNGRFINGNETSRILKHAAVPVFSTHESLVGEGALGSCYTDAYDHGAAAGRVAFRVLSGTPAGEIPPVVGPPRRILFDYPSLQRFNLPLTALPPGSRLLNEPFSFYRKYRGLVWTTVGIISVLSALIVLLAFNILQRRRAIRRSIESEQKFHAIFDQTFQLAALLDTEGRFLAVNSTALRFIDCSEADLLGRYFWETPFWSHDASEQKRVRDAVAAARTGRITRFEAQHRTHEGEFRAIDFTLKPIRDAAGRVLFLLPEGRDITDLKANERRLREQNEILANSHEGVVIVNLANEVSLWNHAAEKMFGWSAAEALGHPPGPLLGIDGFDAPSTRSAAIDRDGYWTGELHARTRDGRKLIVECRVTLVRDEAGQPRARLNFLADITEKKLLQDKLLRNQRLEAIGTLSSGIAHDLNNILAPMLMSAGMLRDNLLDPHDRELVNLIENSARRGAGIIKQLLTFSRGIEGQRVDVQLRHLIEEMASMVRETFPRNLTLIAEPEPDLWPVVADATQLHQVLMNLCVNARDAMPHGGKLWIAAKNVELSEHDTQLGTKARNGPYVLISVRDTGHGIPREIIDRIFDPFFTTKGIGRGTGLGLSTVIGIVRSHGGFVTVYSEPERGAAFNVYLPAVPEGGTVIPPIETEKSPGGDGQTILVVDDEPAILATVKRYLERNGYRVLTAKDGQEALQRFTDHPGGLRLVVTDVMMPVMDGLKLARALRQIDPKVRVVASSGLDPESKSTELAAGFIAEFLNKPYELSALLAVIRRQLQDAASLG